MSWTHVLMIIGSILAALFLVIGTWPLPRNRRVKGVLSPPDHACRRSSQFDGSPSRYVP